MNPFSAFFLQTDSEQNFKQINRLLSFKEETTTQQMNVRPTDRPVRRQANNIQNFNA